MRSVWLVVAMSSVVGRAAPAEESPPPAVRSILVRCLACHNAEDSSGDLDLATRASALKGGESGPALNPGDPAGSRLFKLVASKKMPPKKPLSPAEIRAIEDWIESGATWSEDLSNLAKRAEADAPRWAFRPIEPPSPARPDAIGWSRDPIDGFILEKLVEKGLRPNPEAPRGVWLRRVAFDLTGLPPTPEEVAAFEADARPDAFERVVDRLLASPAYGERWARHWLDLARFAESHGFEYDRLRDHAWRYRDYVIRSFNDDKPYARFIREQIAGDVIEPVTADGIVATGFLVAGPWDQAGSGQANLIARGRIREEELEDVVGVVGQTFLGLTVQCARCHSHKFDPIPQKDYYRIKAAFEGVGHGDRPALSKLEEATLGVRRGLATSEVAGLEARLAVVERAARNKALAAKGRRAVTDRPRPIHAWTFETGPEDVEGGLKGTLLGKAAVSRGRLTLPGKGSNLRSEPIGRNLREKTMEAWVVLADLDQRGGAAVSVERGNGGGFDALVFGEIQPGKWMAGSELFRRTRDVDGGIESGRGALVHVAVAYQSDGTIRLFREGRPYGKSYRPDGPATELQTYPKGESRVLLGLRHGTVDNGYLRGELEEARIYDRALTPEEIARSFEAGPERLSAEEIDRALDTEARRLRTELNAKLAAARERLAAASAVPEVYAARPFDPPPTKVLARGDFETPGEVVSVGGLSSVRSPAADFGLAPNAPEGERRRRLADWLADPANPLPPRVLVNRIWHYHFGTGLVATPSDFGANGARPSHPALLDRLALDFLAGGGRIKPIHRRIVLSATYRQSSARRADAAAVDAESRLLWRFPPRRLEGEAALDAMLAASGTLNRALGGPSFRPFTVTVFNSSFYNLTDPDGPEFRRRTIYRIHVHSARSPLMESLDCPDPSVKTAKRGTTVTPLQALALMNDSFVERQARLFADRTAREAGEDPARRVERAYRIALGRDPRPDEHAAAADLLRSHPLDRLTWALLNANEFLYLR